MDDVTPQIDAKVAADGAGKGLLRVRLAHHHTTGFGGVLALPNLKRVKNKANKVRRVDRRTNVLPTDRPTNGHSQL